MYKHVFSLTSAFILYLEFQFTTYNTDYPTDVTRNRWKYNFAHELWTVAKKREKVETITNFSFDKTSNLQLQRNVFMFSYYFRNLSNHLIARSTRFWSFLDTWRNTRREAQLQQSYHQIRFGYLIRSATCLYTQKIIRLRDSFVLDLTITTFNTFISPKYYYPPHKPNKLVVQLFKIKQFCSVS